MMSALSRRGFLASIPAFSLLAQTKPQKIIAVEIWQLHGHHDSVRGIDQQYQANPLFIYDELRPKPYLDAPQGTTQKSAISALYLKIKTDGGIEGLVWPNRS